MITKILHIMYVLMILVYLVLVSNFFIDVALPLINMASTGAVFLGAGMLLVPVLIVLVVAVLLPKYIKSHILK